MTEWRGDDPKTIYPAARCRSAVSMLALPLPSPTNLALCDRSRNNQTRLGRVEQIRPAVDDAIERFGADRFGIVIGTSTSGIAEGENRLARLLPRAETLPEPISLRPAGVGIAGRAVGEDTWRHRAGLRSCQRLRFERQGAGQRGSLGFNGSLRRGYLPEEWIPCALLPWPALWRWSRLVTRAVIRSAATATASTSVRAPRCFC